MEPAEHDAVVGVGRAAVGVLEDVVDLAPGGGDAAAGDEAAAVAERDGAALPAVEDPVFGAERVIRPLSVEQHALHDPAQPACCAAAMPTGSSQPSTLAQPVPVRTSSARADDDEGGSGAADGGQQLAGGGDEQRGGQRVVPLLAAGAGLGGTAGSIVGGGPELHGPVRVDAGRADRVDDALVLGGDLGQQQPPNRHQPVFAGVPSTAERRRSCLVSRGSAPSWSSTVAHTCACRRSRSAHAGGAASGPSPRASAASTASAVSTSSRPTRSPSPASGPATASRPSSPTSPSISAARIAGSTGGSGSPRIDSGTATAFAARCSRAADAGPAWSVAARVR